MCFFRLFIVVKSINRKKKIFSRDYKFMREEDIITEIENVIMIIIFQSVFQYLKVKNFRYSLDFHWKFS